MSNGREWEEGKTFAVLRRRVAIGQGECLESVVVLGAGAPNYAIKSRSTANMNDYRTSGALSPPLVCFFSFAFALAMLSTLRESFAGQRDAKETRSETGASGNQN